MEPKFYTVKGTLERCSKQDFFDKEGNFLQDKLFFRKDYWTKKFIGYYRTPMDYPLAMSDLTNALIKKYDISALEDLLNHGLLYKLSAAHHEMDFHFTLYIKTAFEADLFFRDNLLIYNTCYYNIDSKGIVTGPNNITEFDDPNKIRERVQKQSILVLSKKQLFEPYKMSVAS